MKQTQNVCMPPCGGVALKFPAAVLSKPENILAGRSPSDFCQRLVLGSRWHRRPTLPLAARPVGFRGEQARRWVTRDGIGHVDLAGCGPGGG